MVIILKSILVFEICDVVLKRCQQDLATLNSAKGTFMLAVASFFSFFFLRQDSLAVLELVL